MNELPIIRHSRLSVKSFMDKLAKRIYVMTNGKLHANTVTWLSVLAHIPVGYLLAVGEFYWAVPLLIVFGLMDALDGALARASGTASPAGMVLDAFTDRLKETFMHGGIAYYLSQTSQPWLAVLPVMALGFSLSTNYLKAKAEVAYHIKHPTTHFHDLNRMFSDGALSFEVRTTVFIVGVLIGTPTALAVVETIIAIGVWQTPKDMQRILKSFKD